ncbi:MAG: sigma-54 dependent transcriptional regulator [Desulfurivibrionaceae bacterium]|nr:sigma-54 dependent transcriptional regulator [Desulfobulbales bacterium]MDT8335796.1 sigma-54 dependent transcriptional regulator [Desulfurivibrionaceae bacterium]
MVKRILVVDDEKSILDSLAGILVDEGFVPVCAGSAEEGLKLIDEEEIDLVLMDIWMPGMDGLQALEEIKKRDPALPVIMISGHGNIETAVKATKKGAFDFIEKPPSYDKIVVAVTNGLAMSKLVEENEILRISARKKTALTGNSKAIQELSGQIERVAPTSAWVLIRGEHGTGKEVVAQSIHRLSGSSAKPMVELNCAAIPEELIESELFGHEKGSFTGATANRRGKFDQADGGMLFLDEIGDMSLKTQAKILRILQEQKFERVGGGKTISVEVRVLAATNKDLEREIEAGNFRADLFYRLNVVPINVPPLRDRLDDIPLLVDEFLNDMARKGLGEKSFDEAAFKALTGHSWPGNVRELRNLVERAVIMAPGKTITGDDLALLLPAGQGAEPSPVSGIWRAPFMVNDFKEARKIFEREFLRVKLMENHGNISQTAEEIGLERSHLHKKVKTLRVDNE